jgi:hypothetical protein
VVGRWVKVYHPAVTGDTADWYLQRMSPDNRKGIIMPGHAIKAPLRIYPKGLRRDSKYNISYQESTATEDRSGEDLMTNGISFQTVPDGELIYLNLPMHPGSRRDKTPPEPPHSVVKTIGTEMNYSGVELSWLPGSDDNWISYYEIYRNGVAIDKVAKGNYYFDHSAGADLNVQYEVATVDGSANHSAKASAQGITPSTAQVIDDASASLQYSGGGWKHEQNVWAVFDGTQSSTRNSDDAVEYSFNGGRITWYGRLGRAMGRADVFIDGKQEDVIDTYDADEIPNVPVYAKTFSSIGQHTIKIVARGDHGWRSSDSWVVVDGLRVSNAPFTVVDDTPARGIQYSGPGWKHAAGWSHASGHTASWTSTAADAAEYSFHGNGVTWVGKQCPSCGMADVYLDGKLEAHVDTYKPDFHLFRADDQGGWQVPVFQKTWPESGRHVIRIVATSLKNMLAGGHEVYLDSLEITGQ